MPIIEPQIIEINLPETYSMDDFCRLCRKLASRFTDSRVQVGFAAIRLTIDIKNLPNSRWSEEEYKFFGQLESSGLIISWDKEIQEEHIP